MGIEQSGPWKLGLQVQEPFSHFPLAPLQSFGQSFTEQSKLVQPAEHTQVWLRHSPPGKQSLGQDGTEQSAPVKPFPQKQVPL
jgi:hypothetical protein